MLPKKLPNLPHLDIAAYMKTASEVGGDYYDFHLSEDGTLTIAVGDATGHGLKAGTMVSSVKSLFVSLAYHPDIPHIFHRMSAVLKEMKLRGLFMAMTMVKVKGHQMSVSIAGMPSVLIYRAANGDSRRGCDAGAAAGWHDEVSISAAGTEALACGRCRRADERWLAGTLQSAQSEMLDYERIFKALPALANQSSQDIIAALIRLGDEWSEGRPQDDDITFVVLKIR